MMAMESTDNTWNYSGQANWNWDTPKTDLWKKEEETRKEKK